MSQAAAPGVLQTVPIDVDVVIALGRLPDAFHGDPADRLIVATGLAHGMVLATHDRAIRSSALLPIWNGSG